MNMPTQIIIETEMKGITNIYDAYVRSRSVVNTILQDHGWLETDCNIRLISRFNGIEKEWLC